MPDYNPFTHKLEGQAPPVAAGADKTTAIGEAPFAGKVVGVTYTPDAAITGNGTESRTFQLINKGAAGAGTTVIATLAMLAGVNGVAQDEKAITLTVTAADLVIAEGDILAFVSTHVGATGLADPGGLVQVEMVQAQA
jgi:hypothetical protein